MLYYFPVLETSQSSLKKLQEQYVIVPIDKASGNIALVCKRFYAQVLTSELGLTTNGTTTYQREIFSVDQITNRHENELVKKFGIKLQSSQKLLPHIYWLPKLPKDPTKFRFIIAAANCSIKPLAKDLTIILKLFQLQIETYSKKCHFSQELNIFGL